MTSHLTVQVAKLPENITGEVRVERVQAAGVRRVVHQLLLLFLLCKRTVNVQRRLKQRTTATLHILHAVNVTDSSSSSNVFTSGYATTVHGRRCNPHRSTITFANLEIASLWRHNAETIRDREKRRPPRAMKSSELANGENCIALRHLLQNRKWRHWWRHNLGSRWKLQKMARENFSIGALYNITKNQDNPIKTVGRDSFLSPKTPKILVF